VDEDYGLYYFVVRIVKRRKKMDSKRRERKDRKVIMLDLEEKVFFQAFASFIRPPTLLLLVRFPALGKKKKRFAALPAMQGKS